MKDRNELMELSEKELLKELVRAQKIIIAASEDNDDEKNKEAEEYKELVKKIMKQKGFKIPKENNIEDDDDKDDDDKDVKEYSSLDDVDLEVNNLILESVVNEEFNVGNMLPQKYIDGVLKKYESKSPSDIPEKKKVLTLSESAKEFISNSNISPDFVEESSKDSIINLDVGVNISRKLRLTILNISVLNAKLSYMKTNKEDKVKIDKIKQEIIKNEKLKRELMDSFSSEEKKAVKKLEQQAKEEAIEDLKFDDAHKEIEKDTSEVEKSKEDDKDLNKDKNKNSSFTKESMTIDIYKDKINKNNERIKFLTETGDYHKNEINSLNKENLVLEEKISVLEEGVEDKEFKDKLEDKLANAPEEAAYKIMSSFKVALDKLAEKKKELADLRRKLMKGNDISDKEVKELKEKIKEKEKDIKDFQKEMMNQYNGSLDKILRMNKFKSKEDVKESVIEELYNLNIFIEAANIEPEIRDIIVKLNQKGYKTKYSSPGHKNLRKKEDKEPDGVYYGKLYSDARVMFDGKFDFPAAPKYWFWRDVDGNSYLDVRPVNYNQKDGTPDEAFSKWKNDYMYNLKTWVDKLPSLSSKEDDSDKKEEVKESFEEFNSLMTEKFNLYKESVLEGEYQDDSYL